MAQYQSEAQGASFADVTINGNPKQIGGLDLLMYIFPEGCSNGLAWGTLKLMCRSEEDGYAGGLMERNFMVNLDNNVFSIKEGFEKSNKNALLNNIDMILKIEQEHYVNVYVVGLPNSTLYWYGEIYFDLRMLDPSVP